MNKLAVRKDKLPDKPIHRARLAKPVNQMEYISKLSQLAMQIVSDTHKYSILNLVSTIASAEQIKQTYNGQMSTEVEQTYTWMSQQYLHLMESILRQYSTRLMAEVERASTASSDVGFITWVRTWLGL